MTGVSGCVRTASRVWVFLLTLVAFVAAVPLFAQAPTGTILGTVKDPTGGVVAGASVIATDTETALSRSVSTGEDGSYRLVCCLSATIP
jgi:hypothetical protein